MKVLFAPDYRDGNPYQALLATALEEGGVAVEFLQGYRRGLPLARALRSREFDILHLHWPEAYFPSRRDGWDAARILRFPVDLSLALHGRPVVMTAHNLLPHGTHFKNLVRRSLATAYRQAAGVFTHSRAASRLVAETFHLDPSRITVVPHGDLADGIAGLQGRGVLRNKLGWSDGRHCLMFGSLSPYKGIEEAADWWDVHQPGAALHVLGRSWDPGYERTLADRLSGKRNVFLHQHSPDDQELAEWIAAADVVLFNHQPGILTSGAACLARSLDAVILLPESLATLDLGEPHPRVHRFLQWDAGFRETLDRALHSPAGDPALQSAWKERTSWKSVARTTAAIYKAALRRP